MTGPHILVVDDEADIRDLLKEILSEEGYEVDVAADAREARLCRDENDVDLVLLDIWMPDTDGITLLREWSADAEKAAAPVVMMSGHGTVETAVEATRLGAFDFIEKPVSLAKLLRVVELALEEGRSRDRPRARQMVPDLIRPIGKSRIVRALREQVERVASHDTPVLLVGEPGSGREAFARYMHSLSERADGPFVSVVAGSIGQDDAAERFYGRKDGEGSLEGILDEARGGTLFLNEIADLPPAAQSALLAAIESGEFRRVGDNSARTMDVRIVSSAQPAFETAPPRDFRRDLVSQLSVITLHVPPLRDYAEDVPELLRYFVDQLVDSEELPFRRFSVAAQNRLRNYPWPGNVRDLKNLVKRLLIMGGDEEISLEEVEDLLAYENAAGEPLVKQDLLALPLREAREQFERAYLQQQLILCHGKVGQLAKRVGMERTHLYRKLRSLGIDFRQSGGDD
jgi:two-component system nitrogen regulation response regulator NtrX